jgi:hypothetical protein
MVSPLALPTRIDIWEMRCRFNQGRYRERAQTGELKEIIKRVGQASPEVGQPQYTKSLEIRYIDLNNIEVATVQQFVRPDGTLGASGLPDPKRLFQDGIQYRCLKKHARAPEPVWKNTVGYKKLMRIWEPIRCWFWWRSTRRLANLLRGIRTHFRPRADAS